MTERKLFARLTSFDNPLGITDPIVIHNQAGRTVTTMTESQASALLDDLYAALKVLRNERALVEFKAIIQDSSLTLDAKIVGIKPLLRANTHIYATQEWIDFCRENASYIIQREFK